MVDEQINTYFYVLQVNVSPEAAQNKEAAIHCGFFVGHF